MANLLELRASLMAKTPTEANIDGVCKRSSLEFLNFTDRENEPARTALDRHSIKHKKVQCRSGQQNAFSSFANDPIICRRTLRQDHKLRDIK